MPTVNATASYAAPQPQPGYATAAADLLATLPVKGRAPKTGYDRELFGQAWADVDRNGCDTRNEILKTQLTNVTYTNSVPCKVATGTLADPTPAPRSASSAGRTPAPRCRSTTSWPSRTPGRRAPSSSPANSAPRSRTIR